MFTGIEAEGRWSGIFTLFIPCDELPKPEAVLSLLKGHNCTHVYFGAGDRRIDLHDPAMCAYLLDFLAAREQAQSPVVCTIEARLEDAQALPSALLGDARTRIILSTCHAHASNALRASNVELKVVAASHALVYANPQVIPLDYLKDKELNR